MIELITTLAVTPASFYVVNFDSALAIAICYFIATLISLLLNEFVKGVLKYILSISFTLSFAVLVYILYLNSSPYRYVIAGIVLLGGISGLFRWLKNIITDVKKEI